MIWGTDATSAGVSGFVAICGAGAACGTGEAGVVAGLGWVAAFGVAVMSAPAGTLAAGSVGSVLCC